MNGEKGNGFANRKGQYQSEGVTVCKGVGKTGDYFILAGRRG